MRRGRAGGVDPEAVGTVDWFGHPATIAETSTGTMADFHEHLGQLIAYARMNGSYRYGATNSALDAINPAVAGKEL